MAGNKKQKRITFLLYKRFPHLILLSEQTYADDRCDVDAMRRREMEKRFVIPLWFFRLTDRLFRYGGTSKNEIIHIAQACSY